MPNQLGKKPAKFGGGINEPEFITRWVMWVNLFILYVVRHNAITQRPHDHLFQKSWHLGATCISRICLGFSLLLNPNTLPVG